MSDRPALRDSGRPLQHLDLVAVGICHEEETRDDLAAGLEIHQLARLEPFGGEAGVFRVEIIDRNGHMAIAVAERIGLCPPLVDRQLELEPGLGIAEIDQGERLEIQPVGNRKSESACIEIERTPLVQNPDHRVNYFRHGPHRTQSF